MLLPSTDYLVRILDGRVDAQGTPDQLRASGELEGLIAVEEAEAAKDEPITASETVGEEVEVVEEAEKKSVKKRGPGKKLIQGESNFLDESKSQGGCSRI